MIARPPLPAVSLLTLSYLRVFPGMGALLLVGVVCAAAGLATQPAVQRSSWLAAAGAFLVALPCLFAGSHFRALASRRSHALLPGFVQVMVVAALGLFGLLALIAAMLLALAIAIPVWLGLPVALLACSALFWFGFLPTPLRALIGFVLIALLLRGTIDPASMELHRHSVYVAIFAVIFCAIGWLCFAGWFQHRMATFRVFERSELAHWNLPMGMNVGQRERIGSAAGTLLLGIGDAWSSRALRAAIGGLLVPLGLFALLYALLPTAEAQRWIGAPVPTFLTLAYALGYYTHLCQRAAQRRPLLWLRCADDWSGLRRVAERALLAEWLALAGAMLILNLTLAACSLWRFDLLALCVVWLLALLYNQQLALYRSLSDAVQMAAIFAQLLLLVLCLALIRIGEHPALLWWFAAAQIAAIVTLRLIAAPRIST